MKFDLVILSPCLEFTFYLNVEFRISKTVLAHEWFSVKIGPSCVKQLDIMAYLIISCS